VLALVAFRVQGALPARVLLAPLVALLAVELLGLAGPPAPAAVCLVTAAGLALPLLGWLARQVLDAEPDEQARLSRLAVGGEVRESLAGLTAAYVLTAPVALLCAVASLVHVDDAGVRVPELVAGVGLALAVAAAAVAVGALASRAVAGSGGASVLVLVAAPVLVAVLGLARSPLVRALVPRLDDAVRAAEHGRLAGAAPGVVAQVLLWSAVVLAGRLLLVRR
jgi:hypothetical protein